MASSWASPRAPARRSATSCSNPDEATAWRRTRGWCWSWSRQPRQAVRRRLAGGGNDNIRYRTRHGVGLLVNDGCFASGVAALLDVLGAAHAVRTDVDPSIA